MEEEWIIVKGGIGAYNVNHYHSDDKKYYWAGVKFVPYCEVCKKPTPKEIIFQVKLLREG